METACSWMHYQPTLCINFKVSSLPCLSGKDDLSRGHSQRGRARPLQGMLAPPHRKHWSPSLSSLLGLFIQRHSLMHAIGTHPSAHFDQKKSFCSRREASTKADQGLGPIGGPSCPSHSLNTHYSRPTGSRKSKGDRPLPYFSVF